MHDSDRKKKKKKIDKTFRINSIFLHCTYNIIHIVVFNIDLSRNEISCEKSSFCSIFSYGFTPF